MTDQNKTNPMLERFKQFLEEYLENVKRKLPNSYRANQLNAGGMEAELVYNFETQFLAEPFAKSLKKERQETLAEVKKRIEEFLDEWYMVKPEVCENKGEEYWEAYQQGILAIRTKIFLDLGMKEVKVR